MPFFDTLKKQLILHEGEELKPYPDSVGKLTIGIGHNLTDKGITKAVSDTIFLGDYQEVNQQYSNNFPNWELDDVRRLVIYDMIFNLGINRFLGFKKMIDAITAKDYDKASEEMGNSLWFRQVGDRGKRLQKMMQTGKMPKELL